jgi:hypothetical protein
MSASKLALDLFDPDALRLPESALPVAAPRRRKPPRHRAGEPFLRGPIPWRWLQAALRLPGKALHVAVLLWRQAGFNHNRHLTVKFSQAWAAKELQAHFTTVRRSLRDLAKAGLVEVSRRDGRALSVTILIAPNPEQEELR